MKCLRFLLVSAVLPLLATAESDTNASTIKLSHPEKPATLRISISQGDLTIVGSDRADIAVETSAEPERKETQRPDGLRVISTAAGFTLEEKDNVVDLRYGQGGFHGADFKISVPKTTSVQISNAWGADIKIESVSGDIDIKNMTGEVSLDHVSGGALVETMNGEIKAVFDRVPENKPLSFTSMNGEIEVRVPAETKANLRLRTQNGTILTDFPEDAMKTKTSSSGPMYGKHVSEAARIAGEAAREAARVGRQVAAEVRNAMRESGMQSDAEPPVAPEPPRPPAIPAMVGGKVVTGELNGGGTTDIQVATMNGDIIVRKLAK